MKNYKEIEPMKLYREKMYLPFDKENKSKGMIVFSLNNSQKSIAKIMRNEHPMILNYGNSYNAYFYDYKNLKDSVKSKVDLNVRIPMNIAKKELLSDYENFLAEFENTSLIKTPIEIRGNFRWNMIYDMIGTIRLYDTCIHDGRLKSVNLYQKLSSFFDTIEGIYTNKISDYKNTVILVNLDEYSSTKNKDCHVLHNLFLVMKRSGDYIKRFSNLTQKYLFYTEKGYFLFDASKNLDKKHLSELKRLVNLLKPSISVLDDVMLSENNEIKKQIVKNAATPIRMKFTKEEEPLPTDVLDMIDSDDAVVKDISDKVDVEDLEDEEVTNKIEEELTDNEELKRKYADALRTGATGTKKSDASLKRDKELREKQKKLKVKNQTLEEITKEKSVPVLKPHKVNLTSVTNENMKNMKYSEFNKTYNEELYLHDIMSAVTCLNDKSIPVNIVNIDVQDTSDEHTLKETYTITLEDENRKRHTLKFNLPIIVNDEFIYVNGSTKTIQTQIFAYPVVKTGPDEVQICTNYNKMFIRRYGKDLSRNSIKFRKLMEKTTVVTVKKGCNTSVNEPYLTCMEYDEFAKTYNTIEIGKATFVFNQKKLTEMFGGKVQSSLDTGYLVGYTGSERNPTPIIYEMNNDKYDDFITLMVSYAEPKVIEEFQSYTTGKKFIHTKATVMAKNIPVVILLSYFEGLTTVIRKFNHDTVRFTDKKSSKDGNMYIKFADGYLTYPLSDMEACMLFNGLTEVTTGAFTIAEMDDRVTYLDIFSMLFGSGLSIADALLNYYDFMIDPITLEILKLLDYPEDLVSLIIFANNMLADNSYSQDIDLHNYRIRKTEMIAAILYKNIATSYSRYRRTANNPNPQKITMDENKVIKDIVALPTVEDYPELSPMVELHKRGIASMKGATGMNMERAYKLDKRAYHNSMVGMFGISTDPGPNAGVIRQMVAEPTIVNARGFMELSDIDNINTLKDVNLATPVEMLTPLGYTHDNATRTAMSTKQTCHVVPVEQNCPILVSTGMDQIVHYRTGDDFSVVAKDDGKVLELDEELEVMIVEYKNGTKQSIDLSPRVAKNGGGGFYLMNQQKPRFKKGNSFKKDDILSYDPKYYKEQGLFGNRMTMGSLTKVVVESNFATYEDSSFITKRMSESLATNISMPHQVILGKNSNVDYIVKIGDHVTIGDDLIRFDTSYDDQELNRLLAGVRADMKEEIIGLGKTAKHTHYTGVVSDIVIESTVPVEELSPSLKKIVSDYQGKIRKKKKLLDKYDPESKGKTYRMGMRIRKTDEVVEKDEYGKVRGKDVGDGVIIDIYVTYHDELSDGDKLASFTANKNTIGYQIPRGFEPYAESRPYEEISSTVAPSAILQRGTPSIITTGCAYKVLIELKRHMYELLTGESFDEVLKQKQPYMIHEYQEVKESENVAESKISETEIGYMESAYNLKYTPDGYKSSTIYNSGDIILPLSDNYDMTPMLEKFQLVSIDDDNHNAIVRDDFIVAIKTIDSNTPIRVKL